MSEITPSPGEVWTGPAPKQPSTQRHSLRATVQQIATENPATEAGPGPWCVVSVYTDHIGHGGKQIFAAEAAQYAVNNLRHHFRGKGFQFGRDAATVLARHIEAPAPAMSVEAPAAEAQ